MTLEKKIAIASVALCLLTSLAFSIYLVFVASYLDEAETSVRIQIFLGILALSWGAMIASFILYTRLRSAAVSAAALLAFAIYVLLIYLFVKDSVSGDVYIWLAYSVWCVVCFGLSILIVLFKPTIFTCSAKSAFFSTLIINLLAVPLAIMIFKIM